MPRIENLEDIFNAKDVKFYYQLLDIAAKEGFELDKAKHRLYDWVVQLQEDYPQRAAEFFMEILPKYKIGFTEIKLVRAFYVEQAHYVWDYTDEREIGQRRHWYLNFKQFAIMMWMELHNEKMENGDIKATFQKKWDKKTSEAMKGLIRNAWKEKKDLRYSHWAVKDQSRQFWEQTEYAFENIFLFGEKDSTTPLFQRIVKILGLKCLYSAHGKSAMAGVEKIFDKITFDASKPIVLLGLSDWDKDGIKGVESGTIKHVKLYCEKHGYEFIYHRVGISPEDIDPADQTPMGKCYILPKKIWRTNWAKNKAIWYTDSKGTRMPMGIELEAFPVSYYREKILTKLLEIGYTLEDFSDYCRDKETPDISEYNSKRSNLAYSLAEDNPDLKEMVIEKEILEARIEEIDQQIEIKKEEIRGLLKPEQDRVLALPDWDSRQRKWDTEEKDWDPESIKDTYEKHEKEIWDAVRKEEDLVSYWNGALGFEKRQLERKLGRALKAYFNANHSDMLTDEDYDSEDYEITFQKKTGEEVKQVITKIVTETETIEINKCDQCTNEFAEKIEEFTTETPSTENLDECPCSKCAKYSDNRDDSETTCGNKEATDGCESDCENCFIDKGECTEFEHENPKWRHRKYNVTYDCPCTRCAKYDPDTSKFECLIHPEESPDCSNDDCDDEQCAVYRGECTEFRPKPSREDE